MARRGRWPAQKLSERQKNSSNTLTYVDERAIASIRRSATGWHLSSTQSSTTLEVLGRKAASAVTVKCPWAQLSAARPAQSIRRVVRIPVVGRIAAASPSRDRDPDDFVDYCRSVPDARIPAGARHVMIEDHIDDGDLVVVRRSRASTTANMPCDPTTRDRKRRRQLKRFTSRVDMGCNAHPAMRRSSSRPIRSKWRQGGQTAARL